MSCGLTRAELSSVAAFASFSNERTSSQAASPARPVKPRENRTSTGGAASSSASRASSSAVSAAGGSTVPRRLGIAPAKMLWWARPGNHCAGQVFTHRIGPVDFHGTPAPRPRSTCQLTEGLSKDLQKNYHRRLMRLSRRNAEIPKAQHLENHHAMTTSYAPA